MKRQLLHAALLSLATVNVVQADPGKTFIDIRPGQGDSIDEGTEARVVETRKLIRVWVDDSQIDAALPAVDSNVIFMHRCAAGNPCSVARSGTNDSRTTPDHSTIVGVQSGTLSPFSRGDTVWNNTMACMRDVFQPFGVTITDVDPGSASHYEIMVGGTPGQLGFDSQTGGVSPATCGQIPSSLVFVFDVWGNNVEDICSTAAQEIAHSWSLDHVTDASDPMTYFPFSGRRYFKAAGVTCGSDCVSGQSPFGATCSGANLQTHTCACGGATQNSDAIIKGLFGDGGPRPPPIVTINTPKLGDHVQPGFPVTTDVMDMSSIGKVELYVDNVLIKSLTTRPYVFNGPDTLAEGTHTVKVTGYDVFGTAGSTSVQVVVGKPCGKPSDCPNDTDTCIGGRCVPGPGVQGGLGTNCTAPTECASGQCAMTTDGSYCVEPCVLGADQCPSGFGCLDTNLMNGNGVCFPGFDDGGGGCATGGNSAGAPIIFGLGFAVLVFGRRRRRS